MQSSIIHTFLRSHCITGPGTGGFSLHGYRGHQTNSSQKLACEKEEMRSWIIELSHLSDSIQHCEQISSIYGGHSFSDYCTKGLMMQRAAPRARLIGSEENSIIWHSQRHHLQEFTLKPCADDVCRRWLHMCSLFSQLWANSTLYATLAECFCCRINTVKHQATPTTHQ